MAATDSPQLIPPPKPSTLHGTSEGEVKDHALSLSHVLRRILDRVTPQNYEAMKKELFDLPIRQCTDEEIADVVHLLYASAVRPEPEPDTEMYADLLADLVKHTRGKGQSDGTKIRNAIVDMCQQQFDHTFRLADAELHDADGNPLPQDDIYTNQMQLKATFRANVNFAGHLFVQGMLNEKIVNYVLYHLLYGRAGGRPKTRPPEEYEVEMFVGLLRTVAKRLSPGMHTQYIPGYMRSLETLVPKVTNRTQRMLQDLLELYKNKWSETRRAVSDRTTGLNEDDAEHRAGGLQPET